MARKAKSIRRRSTAFNISKFAESYVQAEILVRGTTGSGIMSFFTGSQDLRAPQEGYSGSITMVNPDGVVSLSDLVSEPSLALQAMYQNGASNLVPMALSSIGTRIGFKLFRKILSPQRRALNDLSRQVLGRGQISF
jgi:hypothetical protein